VEKAVDDDEAEEGPDEVAEGTDSATEPVDDSGDVAADATIEDDTDAVTEEE
jgi:hypothetical protein